MPLHNSPIWKRLSIWSEVLACCIRYRRARAGTKGRSSCNWHWACVCLPPRAVPKRSHLTRARMNWRRAAATRTSGSRRSMECGSQLLCRAIYQEPARSQIDCSRWPNARETMVRASRRIMPGGRCGLPGTGQTPASMPMPGAGSTIRQNMRPIASSMADMIPAFAPDPMAHRPNGYSDIPRRSLASMADTLVLAERIAHPFTLSVAHTHVRGGLPQLPRARARPAPGRSA